MTPKTQSGKEISKIGIGSYGIGGRGHRYDGISNPTEDREFVDALIRQFEMGYNFTEISVAIGNGKSANLISTAIKKGHIDREDLFLTHSLYPKDLLIVEDIEKDTRAIEKAFGTTCFDSTLVTLSLLKKLGEKEVLLHLERLLKESRTRFVSLSNANIETIQMFKKEFGELFYAHEAHLSFEIRENDTAGILDLCDSLGITNVIWRPLRVNKTMQYNWPLLVELAEKYKKTQNQIVLNWMIEKGCKPMVMSKSIEHIAENWDSQSFTMDESDYARMQAFRVPGYTSPKIDWDKSGEGISVALLPDVFDEEYKKQQ